MGVVVARPRRRAYRSFGRRKHAGEACSIITGHDHLRRGHFLHQVSLGRGLALNGLPPLHVYVSQSAAALGGSTRQTRMLSQVEAQLSSYDARTTQKSFKHSRQKLFIQGQQKTIHLQKKKGTQEIQNRRKTRKKNVPKRQEIRSCSICLISNTFTDKRILNLVVHLIPQRWTGFESEGPLVEA